MYITKMIFTDKDIRRFNKNGNDRYISQLEKLNVIFTRTITIRLGAVFGFILDRLIPMTGILFTIFGNRFGREIYKITTRKSFGILEKVVEPFCVLHN